MTISATIIGRLGADPETRHTQSGKSVTELRVATEHGWGDHKTTTWVSVSLWGARGENAAKFFRKGDQVILTGCGVYNEVYNDKTYMKATAQDFVFVAKPKEGGSQQQEKPWTGTNPNLQSAPPHDDSDVPF